MCIKLASLNVAKVAERLRNRLQSDTIPVRIRTLALSYNDLKLSMAAIAAGKFLFPSRTQKISPPAFRTVLRYESPREIRIAAMLN